MINNEFHIIGFATTDFIKSGSDSFRFFVLKVEVDCFGRNAGKTKTAIIQVLPTNKLIDVYQKVRGKQVIVEGYIDFYTKDNENRNRCIAVNISVLGVGNKQDTITDYKEIQAQTNEDEIPF